MGRQFMSDHHKSPGGEIPPGTLPHMSKACADLNKGKLSPGHPGLKPDPNAGEKRVMALEKELQTQVEQWLTLRGYRRLTADNAQRDPTDCRGYFGHWTQSKRNPLMLDLLILNDAGRYLMLELKVGTVKWQPGQCELIAQGYGWLVQTFNQAIAIVVTWEEGEFAV